MAHRRKTSKANSIVWDKHNGIINKSDYIDTQFLPIYKKIK